MQYEEPKMDVIRLDDTSSIITDSGNGNVDAGEVDM